ncbi:hypothetical protein LCGC14_0622450 [marine sediment metagenome]|uniref:Uncharacterized protein n=1 Tax=marine sediment metagenome TaxID=412755 RepID=A0A0F9R9B9_9ZZZZ
MKDYEDLVGPNPDIKNKKKYMKNKSKKKFPASNSLYEAVKDNTL